MLIKVENTAIVNGVSTSAKRIVQENNINKTVIDYGCGKLRNCIYLDNKGFNVAIYDTETQINTLHMKYSDQVNKFKILTKKNIENIEFQYDIILCSFVLNVIVYEKERKEVLRNIYNLLKEQGSLYLEVRTEMDILKSKHIEPFGDGYLLGISNVKTFQKPYNQKSLVELLTSNGFIVQEVNNLGRSIFIKASKGESNV